MSLATILALGGAVVFAGYSGLIPASPFDNAPGRAWAQAEQRRKVLSIYPAPPPRKRNAKDAVNNVFASEGLRGGRVGVAPTMIQWRGIPLSYVQAGPAAAPAAVYHPAALNF